MSQFFSPVYTRYTDPVDFVKNSALLSEMKSHVRHDVTDQPSTFRTMICRFSERSVSSVAPCCCGFLTMLSEYAF